MKPLGRALDNTFTDEIYEGPGRELRSTMFENLEYPLDHKIWQKFGSKLFRFLNLRLSDKLDHKVEKL